MKHNITHWLQAMKRARHAPHKGIMLRPKYCRQARKLLGWTQQELANKTQLAKITIAKFETKLETGRLMPLYNDHVIEVFERAGVKFEANGSPVLRS